MDPNERDRKRDWKKKKKIRSNQNIKTAIVQAIHRICMCQTFLDCVKAVKDVTVQSTTKPSFQFKGVQFYTYSLQSARPVKTIVKCLPPSMEEKRIANALTNKGIKVKKVAYLKRRDNSASSVFIITFLRMEIEAAYKVTDICGIRVTVTPFKSRKGPQDGCAAAEATGLPRARHKKKVPVGVPTTAVHTPQRIADVRDNEGPCVERKKKETIPCKKKQKTPKKDPKSPAKKEEKPSVPQKRSEIRKDSTQESQMINANSDGEPEMCNAHSSSAFMFLHLAARKAVLGLR
ncbi:hypothetical protein Trydic_g641 [Trypoxylus dichotomus]